MARASNRQRLLEAAVTVTQRNGAASLTLDAVAREAGVSKGGLLYHFASKDALLRGLLDWELGSFGEELGQRAEADHRPGAFLRAYLALSVEPGTLRVPVNLLAAYTFDPQALEEMQAMLSGWRAQAIRGLHNQSAALTLLLAADGAWLSGWLGAPISRVQAAALLDQAEKLLSQEEHL